MTSKDLLVSASNRSPRFPSCMTRASTRVNTMDARVTILEGSVSEIQSSVATISSTMQNLSSVLASMEARFASLETHFNGADRTRRDQFDHGDSSNPIGGSEDTLSDPVIHMGQRFHRQESSFQPRPPLVKLEFPRFSDGDDALAWVYRAEHYFDYFTIDDKQKVRMASFHMDNEALQWFQWRNCIKNYPKWEEFVQIFCKEFGPSEFEDFTEALVQLKQLGSLKDYVVEFRRLANRTKEISPVMLRSCFIGGLKSEVRHDVKLLRPSDVHEAIALAFQVDAKLADTKGDKIRWWPIYSSDLGDEPVGRIQLSMDYSRSPVENSNLKYGSVAETVAYDCVLEIAMKVQHFRQRNLLLHGPWKWLLTEFASYYGVSKAYTNLRYLSYVMDVATPTVDCLTLIYDLLADVKEMSTNLLSHQEHCILAKIEDQVRKLVALVFENYKSLEEYSLLGMVDDFRPASGLAAPALAPAVQIYTLLNDILSPDAQLKLLKFFQVAANKRLRMICAETDELVLTSNEGAQKDFLTSYQRMKSLILNIRNEILTDIQILNQNVLPICIDLPNISSCIYSVNLCNRLSTFLVVRPPPSLSPLVAELIIATADFQQDLSLWNISPIKGGVDAKELFDAHIFLWILDKRRRLLGQCKLDKAKWSGVRTEYGTTHFVDYMHIELKGMLDEFEVIISRWPIYSSPLENVIADVEKAIIEALDRHYADVLSPLKDNLTNKILGFKYVQKLSRQSISTYSVPNELGILLNSMKRTLDVLWPQIESQLMSRSSCICDGYATGEHLNDVSALLRTKLRTYRLAIVEKLYENTRVHNNTKLKNIIRRSKAEESVVRSRMQPLEVLLREMVDHLHTVVDPTVFVELCREFWDRMGQDVLHILEDKKEEYKGLRIAVSNLDDIFASEMQRLRGNSLKERDLSPPGSMEEVHSMLKDVARM